jgi:preprotein translocase subunit SecE
VTTTSKSSDAPRQKRGGKGSSSSPFSRLWLFIRQVVAELRKVVTPTKGELASYTATVIVFVLVMIGIVFGLDSLFSWLTRVAFVGV